jgi:hypothetical protein
MLKAFLGRATHNVLGEGYPRCLHRLSQAQACGVDAPKYDSHPPAAEDDNDGDAGEEGGGDGEGAARARKGGGGGLRPSDLDASIGLINHCKLILMTERTDRRRRRAAAVLRSNRAAFEPERGRI